MNNTGADFLLLNFDGLSYPAFELKFANSKGNNQLRRWGLAWYPSDNGASIVTKDPAAREAHELKKAMTNWDYFRSTVYLCRVRDTSAGYTQYETQPFSRSFAGRDWLFMHKGELSKKALKEYCYNTPLFLEPLGKTDSELAFCYFLSKVREYDVRTLSEVPPELIMEWIEPLDQSGSCDLQISDGTTVLCYHGKQSTGSLFYRRFPPPSSPRCFESEAVKVDFVDSRDIHRTALAFSISPVDSENWTQMEPGQLILARRGAIVWDSTKPEYTQRVSYFPPNSMNFSFMDTSAKGPLPIINIRSMPQTHDGHPLTFRTFEVTHNTEYTYTNPVERSTHVFRLQPTEDTLQEILYSQIDISSEGETRRYQDVFGNESIHYNIHKPYSKLLIQSTSRVKIFGSPPENDNFSHKQASIPLVWMPWQRQMMLAYLLPPEMPETQLEELTTYAMSFVERNNYQLSDTLRDMNISIYRDFEYVPGSTSLNTTSFEVFTSRKGVCQDFANLLICLARLLSIPARYRMGYIHTGTNYENKIQSEASHAWVEIYLPYLGWRGFDPTNGCLVGQDHIRVACGRNYIDATPTSGTIHHGGCQESLNVFVKVQEIFLEEDEQEKRCG